MRPIHQLFLLSLLTLGHLSEIQGREEIITLSGSSNERMVTTGNAVQNDIKYELMHLNSTETGSFTPIPKTTHEDLHFYSKFKNRVIMDFPSEDPKQFKPDLPSYYKVASKRGIVFTAIALFMLLTLFSIFYLRIFSGECGGNKTIIRKPQKAKRYSIFTRISVGLLLFSVGFGLTGYLFYFDRSLSLTAGDQLVDANQRQLNRINAIIKSIKSINKKKFNIMYSVLSYEHFQIGWFLDNLVATYQKSKSKSQEIRDVLFLGTKNNMFIKFMVIILTVLALTVTWFFVYKNRSLTNGLVVAFIMGIIAVYMMHVLGSSFNYFSIFVELCHESIDTFNAKKPHMRVRFENSFQSFLTCLPQKETESLVAQMNSLLIAENTLLTVLRNFFKTVDLYALPTFNNLEDAGSVNANLDKIRSSIEKHTVKDDKVDHVLRGNMLKVLDSAYDIPQIYNKASELHNCLELKKWNDFLNTKMCTDGLWYQYYGLIAYLVAFLGICIIGAGFFSSENIIRGLYNEEIQYVKTNKLRYDWN